MSKLGPVFQVEDPSGLVTSRSIGDKALAASAAQGTRLAVVTDAGGRHQVDAVPDSFDPDYLSWESGKWRGITLAASDVDPGGVAMIQNTTGKPLWIDHLVLFTTATPAGVCTVDVGVSVNPIPVGGSNTIFDGIDIRNGGVVRDFDSRLAADHPLAGRPGGEWQAGEWLSVTMRTGATAGLTGRLMFQAVDHNAVGWTP